MVILRAFLALLAGFADHGFAGDCAYGAADAAGAELGRNEGKPQPGYMLVNLGYSFLAAAAGGYVTAWAAAANPLIHVLALAIVVLALSALSVLQSKGKQPIWYQLTLVAIYAAGRAGRRVGAAQGAGDSVEHATFDACHYVYISVTNGGGGNHGLGTLMEPEQSPVGLQARVRVSAKGRVVIPAAIRNSLGIAEGGVLELRVVDGEVRASTLRSRIQRVQERASRYVKPGTLVSDELSAERREAARHE